MATYGALPGFDCLHLEDSRIRAVVATRALPGIEADLVLTEAHPGETG